MQTFIEDLYLDLTSDPVFSNIFFSILVVIISFLILFLVQSFIKKYLKHAAAKQIHVARFKTLSKLLFSLLRYSVFIIAIFGYIIHMGCRCCSCNRRSWNCRTCHRSWCATNDSRYDCRLFYCI